MSDEQDYKDYLEYQDYLKSQGGGTVGPFGMPAASAARVGQEEPLVQEDPILDVVSLLPQMQLAKGLGKLGGLAKMGLGATQTGAQAVAGPDASTGNVGLSAFLGGLIPGAGHTAGAAGDWAMQKAAGIKKMIPGAGKRLSDMGVWGTKKGMQRAVGKALPEEEAALQRALGEVTQTTPAARLSGPVSEMGEQFKLSGGQVPAHMQPFASKVQQTAESLEGLGDLPPADILKLKRQGDWLGYTNAGNPSGAFEGELGKRQADAARGILSELSPEVSERLANEQALVAAKKGLSTNPSLFGILGQNLGPAAAGGMAGYSLGGLPGAAAGASLGTNLGKSVAGKTLFGAEKLGQGLSSPLGRMGLLHTIQQPKKPSEE